MDCADRFVMPRMIAPTSAAPAEADNVTDSGLALRPISILGHVAAQQDGAGEAGDHVDGVEG
jgi:hypothetical protein